MNKLENTATNASNKKETIEDIILSLQGRIKECFAGLNLLSAKVEFLTCAECGKESGDEGFGFDCSSPLAINLIERVNEVNSISKRIKYLTDCIELRENGGN